MTITEIFRTFGPEYLSRYPDMPLQHKKTFHAMVNCRSGHLGATVYRCEGCGKKHLVDRSCGNRHCPQCQYHKSRQWLRAQLQKRLPGNHFLITFTVPEQLRDFCRTHQDAAYDALFRASSEAIKNIGPSLYRDRSARVYLSIAYLGKTDAVSSPLTSDRPRRWSIPGP